jgi:ATP-dependent exoDNAse (exonuclease V) beta subunit
VARELPVLAAPSAGAAVGYLAGVVDLVYRDPESGRLVVADWKTDAVRDERRIWELGRRYAAQGEVYVRALHEALDLAEPPRFELWLLAADRLEVVASPV